MKARGSLVLAALFLVVGVGIGGAGTAFLVQRGMQQELSAAKHELQAEMTAAAGRQPQWERKSLLGPSGLDAALQEGWEVERAEREPWYNVEVPRYFLRRDALRQPPSPAASLVCASDSSSAIRGYYFDIVNVTLRAQVNVADAKTLFFRHKGLIRNNCNVALSAELVYTFRSTNNDGVTRTYTLGTLQPGATVPFEIDNVLYTAGELPGGRFEYSARRLP